MNDEKLRYPIVQFVPPQDYQPAQLDLWLNDIRLLPSRIQNAAKNITEKQLDTPYRTEGWTLRQVVHHLADSHMNALLRFKIALTETTPLVRPFDENSWSLLTDYQLPIEPSLMLLEGIHKHLTALLTSLSFDQWDIAFLHTGTGKMTTLKYTLGLYAWHGNHHLAHLTEAINNF